MRQFGCYMEDDVTGDMVLTQDPRIMKYLVGSDMVVDLGCGSGQVLDSLTSRYKVRLGLDMSNRMLQPKDERQVKWKFIEANLNERFPLEDGCADMVMANQVIEHITEPYHFAQEAFRILRPGGRFMVTTPNIRYLKIIWLLLSSGYGPRTAGENICSDGWDSGHIHYFTHRDISETLASVGFRIVADEGLVDLSKGGVLRRVMSNWRNKRIVREFLTGNIFIVA